LDEAGKVQN